MATSTPKDAKPIPKAKSDPKTKQEPDKDAAAPAAVPRKKRNPFKMLLFIAPVLLAAGGAAWHFQDGPQSQDEKPQPSKQAPAKVAKAVSGKPPAFVPLESFTVNLQQEDAAQYLQVGLTLKIADPAYGEAIKLNMPDIRNRILLLLSNKKASELSTLDGKQSLATEIMQETAKALGASVPAGGISSALFTSFVIQ